MEILKKKSKVKGDKTESYYRYEAMVKRLLTLVGLWPSENSVWSYYGRSYIVLLMTTLALTAMINHILHDVTTTHETIEVASFSTSASISVLKIFLITINRNEVSVLYKKLRKFLRETEQDGRLIEYGYEKVNLCYSLARTLTFAVFGSFVAYVVIPFFSTLLNFIRDSATVEFPLIYPARYPWDPRSNQLVFIGTYTMELVTIFSTCVAVSGIDGFVLLLICQGVIDLRAMAYRLNHIGKSEDYEDVMKKCVQHWVFLTHLRDELQRIYGPLIVYNVVTSAVLLCSLMFQLAQVDLSMEQIVLMIVYFLAKALQLYVNTWSGTLLQEESEKYLISVYLSDWLGAKSSSSTYITLFQRPLIIRACHLLDASVEVFAKTMNTTISYYLMLRSVA